MFWLQVTEKAAQAEETKDRLTPEQGPVSVSPGLSSSPSGLAPLCHL